MRIFQTSHMINTSQYETVLAPKRLDSILHGLGGVAGQGLSGIWVQELPPWKRPARKGQQKLHPSQKRCSLWPVSTHLDTFGQSLFMITMQNKLECAYNRSFGGCGCLSVKTSWKKYQVHKNHPAECVHLFAEGCCQYPSSAGVQTALQIYSECSFGCIRCLPAVFRITLNLLHLAPALP